MKTTLLCVLDGFGLNPNSNGNAVALANKPTFDRLWEKCPHSTLITFGPRVGLPEGQMGNSEVGHMNIGAGRVTEQWLLRISNALKGGFLAKSKEYQSFVAELDQSSAIHLVGLFSDGGVHSHSNHLFDLVTALSKSFSGKIFLDLITDGRDTSPFRAGEQLPKLLDFIKQYPAVQIASIVGRFFAMDRDKRWERTEKGYRAIFEGTGTHSSDVLSYIQGSYAAKITDEFMEPAIFEGNSFGPKDGVIFWNFREDRMRQIVAATASTAFDGFSRKLGPIPAKQVLCFTEYDHSLTLPYLFQPLEIENHLGQVIANNGLAQLRVAETEKYAHVTYFFNGGVEADLAGEERALIPSPRDVKTYDLKPQMSAKGVMDAVIAGIDSGKYALIVVNFANCDMVGHTGVLEAGIKAVETVDSCLGQILVALERVGGQAVIIADHGNAEQMINYEDGSPHTSHTLYPVPIIIWGANPQVKIKDGGALCNVAPTVLRLMGLVQPNEMTAESLID